MQQRASQIEPPPQPAGERRAGVVRALGQLQLVKQFGNPLRPLRPAQPKQPRVQIERLPQRHQIVGRRLLKHDADPAPRARARRLPEHAQLPLLRLKLARNQPQNGALARPVGPEQRDPAPRLDIQLNLRNPAPAGPLERRPPKLG